MEKISLIIALLLIFCSSSISYSNPYDVEDFKEININTTEYQYYELIHIAKQSGIQIGFPDTIPAILLQETNGGKNQKSKQSVFGVMQMKVSTAKYIMSDILNYDNIPSNKTIKHILTNDDKFAIYLAAVYFKYLYDMFIDRGNSPAISWRLAVLSYNAGPSAIATKGKVNNSHRYISGINKNIKIIKSYNN